MYSPIVTVPKGGEMTVEVEAPKIDVMIPMNNSDNPQVAKSVSCLLYTSPSPRDYAASRMPSSA